MDCSQRPGHLSDSRSDWLFDIIPVQGQMPKGEERRGICAISSRDEERNHIFRSHLVGLMVLGVVDRVHFMTRHEFYTMEATASEHAPTKRSRMSFPSVCPSDPESNCEQRLDVPRSFRSFLETANRASCFPSNSPSTRNEYSKLARLKPPTSLSSKPHRDTNT